MFKAGLAVATFDAAQAVSGQLCFRAQRVQRLQVAETIFVYRLVDNRNAVGLREQDGEGLLPIRREAGVDICLDYGGAQWCFAEEADTAGLEQFDAAANLLVVGKEVAERFGSNAMYGDIAVGCAGQAGPGSRLDAISHHLHVGTGEPFHTLDTDISSRRSENDGPHSSQHSN